MAYSLTHLTDPSGIPFTIFNNTNEATNGSNKVLSVGYSFDAGIMPVPIPTGTSGVALAPNIKGKSQIMTLNGEFYGSNAQIKAFINELKNWFNVSFFVEGKTVGRAAFVDDIGHTYNVKPMTFDWDKTFRNPGFITYNLQLMEALI